MKRPPAGACGQRGRLGATLVASLALLLTSRGAEAQDALRLNQDPTWYTDVIDAFDEGDPFDLDVRVGFRREQRNGTIRREQPGERGLLGQADVGDWRHVRNVLDLGLNIGVFRDVMIYGRVPVVLSDERRILAADGGANGRLAAPFPGYESPTLGTVPGGSPQSFYLPFESPTRSGIERLDLGLAFSPMNQARRPALPTWMMMFELQLGIGQVMQPCESGGLVRDPSTGNPVLDGDGAPTPRACNPGISEGTHAFRFETRLSRRYRHAEPYMGASFLYTWPGRAESTFRPGGNLAGHQHDRPPVRGGFAAGVAFIPWENRATWQRFTVDLRAQALYVSEGRDYSPLYDALGSSQHPYFTEPNLEGIPRTDPDPELRRVPFTGVTTVGAHAQVKGTLAIEMQAARYVRFQLGTTFTWITAHSLTNGDACNASVSPTSPSDPRVGTCLDGILDPHFRGEVDTTGRRFHLTDAYGIDLFVRATAQF